MSCGEAREMDSRGFGLWWCWNRGKHCFDGLLRSSTHVLWMGRDLAYTCERWMSRLGIGGLWFAGKSRKGVKCRKCLGTSFRHAGIDCFFVVMEIVFQLVGCG